MQYIGQVELISDEDNPKTHFSVNLYLDGSEGDRPSTLAEQLAVGIRLALDDPDFVYGILNRLDRVMEAQVATLEQIENGN